MSNFLEEKEEKSLASYAVKSKFSKGRKNKESFSGKRLCFQRDRDRIIHSKAFRRLDQKTQVFTAGKGDHFRTRLTHTLEVSQISRDLANQLKLNENLCEAIALAHDLGHPPFGHAGEETLNEIMQKFNKNFEHNQQSKLVVEKLEKTHPDFDGLNLTIEVLEGLMKHQTAWDQEGIKFEKAAHLEAQVVNLADEIAYSNHDIDDGLRSGIINLKQLRKLNLWIDSENLVIKKFGEGLDEDVLISRTISQLMSLMIENLIKNTKNNLKINKIKTLENVRDFQGVLVEFNKEMAKKIKELRVFLYQNFYLHPEINNINEKGKNMIKKIFNYYYNNFEKLPKNFSKDKNKEETIKNYIAGMTDRFLKKEYANIKI